MWQNTAIRSRRDKEKDENGRFAKYGLAIFIK